MKGKAKRHILNIIKTAAMPVIVIALFAMLTGGRSLNERTLIVSLRQSVMPIMISMALVGNMTLSLIDFSAGGVVLASAIIGGNLMNLTGTGITGLVLFCVVTGVVLTTLTGFLNNKLRVPTIVLTLGMLLIYEALPRALFQNGATISIKYTALAQAPWIFIILAVVFVAFYIIFNLTNYGHNIRALGGSEEIARTAGLNLPGIKQLGFTISGIFLGMAAVIYMSSSSQILNVTMFGSMGMMMDAFMGVFLAFFLSKYCNLAVGVLVGTFTMVTLANGFVAMGLASTMRDIMTGVFLLVLLGISANQPRLQQWRANRERVRLSSTGKANNMTNE